MIFPTDRFERELEREGFVMIGGVDEAGAGALAGPIVAGAVVLPKDYVERLSLKWLRDSKTVPEARREEMRDAIVACAVGYGVGVGSVEEIAELGIRRANYLAMRRAVIDAGADAVIVDAWTIPELDVRQLPVVRADKLSVSVSAGSLLAKVERDRMMRALSSRYPQYGFDIHKGYGTKSHLEAIRKFGPCAIHRLSYKTFSVD